MLAGSLVTKAQIKFPRTDGQNTGELSSCFKLINEQFIKLMEIAKRNEQKDRKQKERKKENGEREQWGKESGEEIILQDSVVYFQLIQATNIRPRQVESITG